MDNSVQGRIDHMFLGVKGERLFRRRPRKQHSRGREESMQRSSPNRSGLR
jgi:hypothetical protein